MTTLHGRAAGGLVRLLRFALLHSVRDMGRNRARTLFALVCVATGVAAVVALRTLAFMVGDELTTNLAQINRGDLRIYASRGVPGLVEQTNGETVFSAETVSVMREWAAYEGVTLSLARMQYLTQIKVLDSEGWGRSAPGLVLFVEPDSYPFYGSIKLIEPLGQSLKMTLEGDSRLGTPIVISPGLARENSLGLEVGDRLRVGASDVEFVVAGISGPESESVLSVPPTAFFDYAYLPLSALPLLGEKALPDQVFVKVALGRDIASVEASLVQHLQEAAGPETDVGKDLNRATVPELEKQNAAAAEIIDDIILVMGLSALLIGGIGIVNTMLFVVSQRTLEIAVLKTLGLKAYRVTLLFLAEALLMGVIGSLAGVVMGVVISYVIRDVGETAFRLTLNWRFYPEAATSGIFLGVMVTGLFGFLPTLIAGQVRPAIVLRPNEAQIPPAGLVQVLGTLIVMIAGLGLLVDSIVEGAIDYGPVYMFAGGGALVGLFSGVSLASSGIGRPIPVDYRFRLPRRYERIENALLQTAGWLIGRKYSAAGPSLERNQRGREALSTALRGLRQAALLYGALAIGAALASGIMLVVSQIWRPIGLGTREPPNDLYFAARTGSAIWICAWAVLALGIGALVRWVGRALAATIALGTIGVTFGGVAGGLLGRALDAALYGTGVWDVLSEISTGVVIVEGALALLSLVYVGYWLLVWGVTRLSPVVLLGMVSVVLVSLSAGLFVVAERQGHAALVVTAIALLMGLFLRKRAVSLREATLALSGRIGAESTTSATGRSTAAQAVLSAAILGGSSLYAHSVGAWPLVICGAVVAFWLWRGLKRIYRTEGQLILREMGGRRARVASTLLGLSVGVAGLSLVSLTSGAASHLLSVQIDQTAEGNLLVVGIRPERSAEIGAALRADPGVERFTQFMTYTGVLLSINGEGVQANDPHLGMNEQDDPRENSTFERTERGLVVAFSERHEIAGLPAYQMKEGRRLELDDAGRHYVMLRESLFQEHYNIRVGDRLMFVFENAPGADDDVFVQLSVVGIVSRDSEQTGLEAVGNLFAVPPGTLSNRGVKPSSAVAIAQVDEGDPSAMARVKDAVTEVPGVLAFDLGVVTQLLDNLIEQLRAIPALVAWLALLAGTAIIANTVALAAQERRRQIAVMKAIGLKGRRVLVMLIVEYGLVGFIAGLIGVVVGFALTIILVLASQNPEEVNRAIDFATMGWLVVMSIGVSVGAALFSAWSAAAEKPMNVLRYE